MFLLSYEYNGVQDWGMVIPDTGIVYPASALWRGNAPAGILDCIQRGNVEKPSKLPEEGISLDQVKVLAPIPKPIRNIFCVGKNYLDHIIEFAKQDNTAQKPLEYPAYFTKATHTVVGPYDGIPAHQEITQAVDYEAELAVIIGKKGVNIPVDKAMDHVFGYTILNDVTARDLQKKHLQWFKGKSLDGFCPMGPWVVTRDEIAEPVELDISSRVNGETRQSANTRLMIFDIPTLISVLSQGMTLEPGDILATGTPSGVGMGFEPPKFLKSGDRVRIEIEKIGYIENQVK